MSILSVSEKILLFVCGLGILQGILLAFLIYFRPKSDRSVNVFLSLYIFSTSAVMSLPVIMKLIGWQNSFFIMPLPLLPGPLLYLYLLSFKQRITWSKALPHFILFIVYFFLVHWNLSVVGAMYPDAKEAPAEALRRPVTILLSYGRSAQQLFYFFLARRALLSYQRSIRHLFSETSRIDLRWANFLVYGFLLLVLTFLLIFPLMLSFPEHFNLLLLINMTVATPYIYIATYKGIMQPTLWQLQPGVKKEMVTEEMKEAGVLETGSKDAKAVKTGLNNERISGVVKRMTLLMEQEKLFKEAELTLHQLAAKLQVPTYQVSQALNDGLNKNFYDLVNSYRVEEAKRLLLDSTNRNFTILSIGFDAGFNSKTTFNTVFKKFTGLTPTEYRHKQNQPAIPG